MTEPRIPNPASIEAVARGCTCCPEKNLWGRGDPINGGANRRWYIRLYCPVHSDFKEID